VGLKFKYQFNAVASQVNKLPNSEDNEPIPKKLKLYDNKTTTILEYSYVQVPVAPFIEYLIQYSNAFVDQCLQLKKSSNVDS
jgi:hypothetical protein